VLPFFFCPATYERKPDLITRYRHKLARLADLEGLYQTAQAVFQREDLSPRLGEIRVPTLVIVGSQDIATPPDRAEHLTRCIPGAQLVTISSAGHMSATEQPESVAATIRDFLKALPDEEKTMNFHELTATTIEGLPQPLSAYQGRVVLVVNTASECGYTPQYEGLEDLYKEYCDQGLVVLGFPSNDFGGQEPGSSEEIRDFCATRYKISFPLFEKVKTKGAGQSPVYKFLAAQHGEPQWNFHKYLLGKDGTVRKAFSSRVAPASPELRQAVEAALAE
jgi:glutathione peroxidase